MPEEMLHIEHLDELIEALAKEAPKELDRAVRVAMKKSVIDVTGWAKINAPVDTGRLETSIGHSVQGTFGNVTGFVGSNVEYAPFVEKPGPVRRTGRRPWLKPAVQEHVKEIIQNFEVMIQRAFKKMGF
jgi:hypothetical protein